MYELDDDEENWIQGVTEMRMVKESPTSSAVHVDTVMGNEGGSTRKRKRKKKGLVEAIESLEKAENVPVDKELYARVKAEAKKKFDVYPSAYANAWLVQEYKSRGGKYRIAKSSELLEQQACERIVDIKIEMRKASFASRSEAGRYAAQQRWKDHAKQDLVPSEPIKGNSGREIDMKKIALLGKQNLINDLKEVATSPEDFGRRVDLYIDSELKYKGINLTTKRHKNESSDGRRIVPSKLHEDDRLSLEDVTDPVERQKQIDGLIEFYGSRKNIFWMPPREKVNELERLGIISRAEKAESPSWQRKEGKNPKGGLNAKGRASYARETGGKLRPPVKSGDNPRRASFLARMGNANGPERNPDGSPTRLLLSLQAWGANSKAEARKKAKAISARNKDKNKA